MQDDADQPVTGIEAKPGLRALIHEILEDRLERWVPRGVGSLNTQSPPTSVNQTFRNQIEAIDVSPARQ